MKAKIFCFLLLPLFTKAQILLTDVTSAQSAATCDATVAQTGIIALFNNQAGLADVQTLSGIVASEWRFGVKELKPIAFGLVLPSKSGVFGFTLNHFSFENTREDVVGVAFSKKMSPKLNASLRLNATNYSVSEYGSTLLLSFELGMNYLLFEQIKIGFHVKNPIQQKLNESDFTPSVFRLGVAYQVNEAVNLTLETAKDNFNAADFRMGLTYKIAPNFTVRGGFASAPTRFAFGLSYFLSEKFAIDLGLSSYSALGLTPSVSLCFFRQKEKNK
jgi:long-subunit fatty acid transport protein